MTYYYTYKITCLLGTLKGKYYYGQHHTYNLNDGYCGSGAIIKKYYKKYGAIENVTYTKEIISFYSNATELNEAEELLIGDNYKNDPMCLNITHGSYKEWTEEAKKNASESARRRPKPLVGNMKGKHHTDEAKQKISKTMKENHPFKGKHHTEEAKQKIREMALGRPSSFKGKHHTDENKKYLSEIAKQRPKKCWIHKDENEKYVPATDVQKYINDGYILGRNSKMKELLHKYNESK